MMQVKVMFFNSVLATIASFLPIAVWIGIFVLLWRAKRKGIKISGLSLRSYAIGYGIFLALNVFAIITIGFIPVYMLFSYIAFFLPFVFFGFMLNKKLIQETRLRNIFANKTYKIIATLLIWLIVLYPFTALGIAENPLARNARKQEVLQLQEEVMNFETYADLTQFGLGIYKLQHKGDYYLWDITKPKENVLLVTNDGVVLLFDWHANQRYNEIWDNVHEGMNVMYDVVFFEGMYLIISPLWGKHDRSFYWDLHYVYMCKDLNKDADIFSLPVRDPEIIEKLRELPGEQISRKELAEKLDVDY